MKFMPQDLFEVASLYLARWKAGDPNGMAQHKFAIYEGYKEQFKGDNLWLEQAEQISDPILHLCSQFGASDKYHMLGVAAEARQRFDENMEVISGVRGLFRGTVFAKSHPSAGDRKEIAIKNIRYLFLFMTSRGFVPR
jgi:hypothetical protein